MPSLNATLHHLFTAEFSAGRAGVVAFFCVSGFVVPFSFRGARPLGGFVISRIFRLYPAYWLSLGIAALLIPAITPVHFSASQLAANATMIQRLFGQDDVLGVYWTLLVEIAFYATCFILFAMSLLNQALPNFGLLCLQMILAIAGGIYRHLHPDSDLPVGLPTYLAAMHFGTLVRLAVANGDAVAGRLYGPALLCLIAGTLVANTLAYRHAHNELVGWVAANTGYMAGVGLFLLAVHRGWFAGRHWAWLGLISYSLYLFHPLFLYLAVFAWPHFADWRLATAVLTLFLVGGSILVAAAVQRFVEAPFIGLGKAVAARWSEPSGQRRPADG